MADGNAVTEFLIFSISCVADFVSFLFELPLFRDGLSISFGDGLVALTLLMIMVTALVRTRGCESFRRSSRAKRSRISCGIL